MFFYQNKIVGSGQLYTTTLVITSIRKNLKLFLQLIGIIVIKSKETRAVIYTCRYFSGQLIPNSVHQLQYKLNYRQ